MTAWTAQIRGDGARWAAQVWRPAEHPPPERLLRECPHPHTGQAEALQCARAMRVRLETAEAGTR